MSNNNHEGSIDSTKDKDRLCFKRKNAAKAVSKSPVEESYQGFNGSKDQV